MFDQPPSMAMRAAIASFLGSLFGIGLILATTTAQAQTADAVAASETAAADPTAIIRRIGDATLRSLSGAETLLSGRAPAPIGLRLHAGSEATSGLRWQVTRLPGLRSEGEIPRSRDLISVGMELRF